MRPVRVLVRLRPRHLEALLFLLSARFLTVILPLRVWRKLVGTPSMEAARNASTKLASSSLAESDLAPDEAYRLAMTVRQTSVRLPIEMTCLPQAMALFWMLKRRGYGDVKLHLGVAASSEERFAAHAWLTLGGITVIGETDMAFHPLIALGS